MIKHRQPVGSATDDNPDEEDTFLTEEDETPSRRQRPVPSRRSIAFSVSPSPRVSAFEGPLTEMFRYEKKSRISGRACRRVLTVAVCILFLAAFALSGLLIYQLVTPDEIYHCGYGDTEHVSPRDYNNPDVFDDLTPAEYNSVTSFLVNDANMGLAHINVATVDSSYIMQIELLPPNKDEAIQYLDVGSKKPTREAKVVVVRGDVTPPVVQEYLVSPLSPPMTVKEYFNPSYRRQPIPYTSRPMDSVEKRFLFNTVIYAATEKLYPLLKDSYGRFFHNCSNSQSTCLKVFDLAPGGQTDGERKTWVWLYPEVKEFFVRPLGVQLLVEHSSPNVGSWTVEKVMYNGVDYGRIESLMYLYNEKSLTISYVASTNDYVDHFSYRPRELPSSSPPQGPKQFEPDGKRFDIHGQHIAYHGWEFYYHMRASTGMVLFDLRFDGARIAYEISLQEVAVFYSGYGPSNSNGYFFDSAWLLGASSMELARGIDCPDTAVYLNTFFRGDSGKPEIHKSNVCVFEMNAGVPLRRHYTSDTSGGFSSYGGLTDYHLVIRTIATIRNVDYILDYMFYNDGVVEARATVTGHMHATFWTDEGSGGYDPVYSNRMDNIHQRIFNYKVDIDVTGERNSYNVLDVTLDVADNKTQMRRNLTAIDREITNSTFSIDKPQFHVLYSSGERNQYGAKRAYQIVNKSPSPFLLAEVTEIAAAQWAAYPVVVTRRKETEQQSSSIYANNNPWNPVIKFSDLLDGDDMLDDDLVAWVSIGTYHISGTEDMPSMTTSRGHMSFLLSPHNYFNECPSTKSPDVVVIKPSPSGENEVESFGKSFDSHCLQTFVGPYDYDGVRRVKEIHHDGDHDSDDDDHDDNDHDNHDDSSD